MYSGDLVWWGDRFVSDSRFGRATVLGTQNGVQNLSPGLLPVLRISAMAQAQSPTCFRPSGSVAGMQHTMHIVGYKHSVRCAPRVDPLTSDVRWKLKV